LRKTGTTTKSRKSLLLRTTVMEMTREAGVELIVESRKRAAAVIVRRTHPAAACRGAGWTFAVRVGRLPAPTS
jgi:hypothetical protein